MPGIARDAGQDVAGGAIIRGSSNVLANNKPVVRVGDNVAGHGPGAHAGPVMAVGSGNVFTNNIATCREGDVATCGHPSSGSSNVFVNSGGGGGAGGGGVRTEEGDRGYIDWLNNEATTEFLNSRPAGLNAFDWEQGKQAYDEYLIDQGQPPYFNSPGGGGGGGSISGAGGGSDIVDRSSVFVPGVGGPGTLKVAGFPMTPNIVNRLRNNPSPSFIQLLNGVGVPAAAIDYFVSGDGRKGGRDADFIDQWLRSFGVDIDRPFGQGGGSGGGSSGARPGTPVPWTLSQHQANVQSKLFTFGVSPRNIESIAQNVFDFQNRTLAGVERGSLDPTGAKFTYRDPNRAPPLEIVIWQWTDILT